MTEGLFRSYPTSAEASPFRAFHLCAHTNFQSGKIKDCSMGWEMQQYKAWPNIQTPLPIGFITLLLINPLCSNYSFSLACMIADCCHRANSLSRKVGINIFYAGVKEFERLGFVLFQFHGENIAKLSRSCPTSSERTEMSWARQCFRVRERGSPVHVTMAPLQCPGIRCNHYIPYNLQVISVP